MTIKSELEALQQEAEAAGRLFQVEPVVAWAKRHTSSALHASLEWDDSVAGHEWRCHQVRNLIRVHIVDVEGARQMVSLTIDRVNEGGGYRDINSVVRVRRFRRVLLQDALDELERVKSKYETLTELASVWEEADRVRTRLNRSQRREERQRA